MAVGLSAPAGLLPVAGVVLASTRAIKAHRRDDLTVMRLADGSRTAGVFTQNRLPAAPVLVCREHLVATSAVRGLVINAGIANAGTLGRGYQDAQKTCRLVARQIGCTPQQVLPFSTGVISERLPMARYEQGVARCVRSLAADGWDAAARAILTTDTVAKGMSRRVGRHSITGIAKGSGMIHPNMRTMLAFVATDAAIPPRRLMQWQREITRTSFNAISVDGDTSTNDSFVLVATGKTGAPASAKAQDALLLALSEVSHYLAEAIVRDGEGATKLIVLHVCGGRSERACRQVAEAVACSPLVKTAIGAGDANVGRLIMAIGNAGNAGGVGGASPIDPQKVQLKIGRVPVLDKGGLSSKYREAAANKLLAGDTIRIALRIGSGAHSLTFKTCDLTHRYIEINADYRS